MKLFKKLWLYQKERFPLKAYIPLLALFSFTAIYYSSQLFASDINKPIVYLWLLAFISALALFFQLRIADEFKDAENDKQFRSYLPVPRGLISLKELFWVGLMLVFIEILITLTIHPYVILVLFIVWLYIFLMTQEFFCKHWLRKQHFFYLISHAPITPFIFFYLTSFIWLQQKHYSFHYIITSLIGLLITTFFISIALEISRKIRPLETEEAGVDTYSKHWGIKKSLFAWISVLLLGSISSIFASALIHQVIITILIISPILLFSLWLSLSFLKHPSEKLAKRIETLTGIWIMSIYISLII